MPGIHYSVYGLRALLIHKDTKQDFDIPMLDICLRALLIHKNTKLQPALKS